MTCRAFRQDFGGGEGARPVDLSRWQRMELGGGKVIAAEGGLRFATADATVRTYANAQIDDTWQRARRNLCWRPPLTLTLRARFSHPAAPAEGDGGLRGTAGFGFWNDPFLTSGRRLPALPRTIWFFYASPPSDIHLDYNTAGCGWKAKTLDALHPSGALLALTAPLAVPLMNIRGIYRAGWPVAQRVLRIAEAAIRSEMTDWHTYAIEWGADQARFRVDNEVILECGTPPKGPLGLVIWLDNQYLIATPWGRLRSGLLATHGTQWLEMQWLQIS
jgi:hypothetical protein